MKYSELQAGFSTVWRSAKNKSLYVVNCIAHCSSDGQEIEKCVVYTSCTTGIIHYRELWEFLDGRYEPVGVRIEETKEDIKPATEHEEIIG